MKTLASLTAALMLTTAAGAVSAEEARIQWGDLNMATAAGAEAFDARIEAAARKLCRYARRAGSMISDRAYCQAAVRSEAIRQLPGSVQTDYALSRLPIVV